MILNHINYRMPIYKDCTLVELLITGASIFTLEIVLFSTLTKLIFHFAVIGVAITFVSFFHLTKLALHFLQKLKHDKPHGYYLHVWFSYAMRLGWIKSHFLTRIGKFSIHQKGS